MNRYFARSAALFLTPGPWCELSEQKYAELCKIVKVPSIKTFLKANVEGAVIPEGLEEIYINVDPELYNLLRTPNPYNNIESV